MTPFRKMLQSMMAAGVDLTTGTFEMLFFGGGTVGTFDYDYTPAVALTHKYRFIASGGAREEGEFHVAANKF